MTLIHTSKKRLKTEQFDLPLPLYEIRSSWIWSAGARPVHFALTETDCVDIVAADLQDQTSVHHVQKAVSEDPLLVIGDVLRGRKA